ncbi:MAG: hypothetical protein ACI9R3_002585 [Verrucomicrobiales bacterium]|jgi:hypothetical protein
MMPPVAGGEHLNMNDDGTFTETFNYAAATGWSSMS